MSRTFLLIPFLFVAAACAETNVPESPTDRPVVHDGPRPASVEVDPGDGESEPPPPPIDTMSVAYGSGGGTTFQIAHRLTFTSDERGVMGWVAWGQSEQPRGTKVEGEAQLYYGTGYLEGKGVVRMVNSRGALTIDFARHLDRENAYFRTDCRSERGGACATLRYYGATYTPAYGNPVRVSGELHVGLRLKQ